MQDEIAAIVLAAGAGTRLRPLTSVRPKALCPIGNVPLVDRAIARAGRHAADVAVNVHHGRDQLVAHLDGRVHVSVEEPEALGTAGALWRLKHWIAGRPVLVQNADAWHRDDLDGLVDGWDGRRIRLLVTEDRARPDFEGRWRFMGSSLMPWSAIEALPPGIAGLYEVSWRDALAREEIELIPSASPFIDCGRVEDYLEANLLECGSGSIVADDAVVRGSVVRSVVGPGCVVDGSVRDCVLWDGVSVAPTEDLIGVVRATGDLTVDARGNGG